jgi:hypothetical protein
MDTTSPIKVAGTTSLEDALARWKELSDLNGSLERQVKEYSELSNKLHAENVALKDRIASQEAFYRDQVRDLTDSRDRYKSRYIALITRLAGIKETIEAAARDAAAQEMDQQPPDEKDGLLRTPTDKIEQDIGDVVSKLPHTQMQAG